MKRSTGISTTLIHSGYTSSAEDGALIPPLHVSTTFAYGNSQGYEYSRSGNPTRTILERTLAELEGGSYALAYSSGSAALANLATLVHPEGAILCSADAYGGTYRYMAEVFGKQGGRFHTVDLTDLAAVAAVLQQGTVKLIWAETPTNPLLKVVDIAGLAALAHAHDAWLAIDNTFATPVIQRPLDHGADIVAYSTTKYMNGHSDSVGGALIVRDEALHERLRFLQNAIGAILSPFDSWLTLRGLRTLELRMQRHSENAAQLASLLRSSSKVRRVYYPAFFTGEQQRIVQRQMHTAGGIISLELDERYDPQTFLRALQYFPLAESLGGVESLIDHPATMTHAAIPAGERQKIGLSDGLLRISVGIENPADLCADVRQALMRTRLLSGGSTA